MDLSCDNDDNEVEFIPKIRGRYSENYTQNGLKEAIEKIRNNEMSYGATSKIFNVPKTTLYNKMKNPENSPKGATTILSKDQEAELAKWILLHADFGDPRTKQDIKLAAAEISQLDADSSSNFKNGMPTSGWIDGFLKRHPLCRERTPQGISKASAINTKDDFAGLWRNIYDYFKKTNQLDLLKRPELWWNADETCFEKDKVPKKVIARRGVKRVSRREMGPPKANTTVTYAFSADGDYVEPLITLKDSNSSVAEIAFALGSVGANYGLNQTESGWTKTESFYYFVSMHLHKQWEAKNSPKPRILTIDGYGAHFSLKLFRWCRLNDVIIIVLYPGATPYMQMCDTTMFSPMKRQHEQLYSQWRLKNPTKTMNDVEFVKILKQINDAVIKKESIINGWRATGLQPFNFNNLKTDSLLSKSSSNRIYDFKGDYTEPPELSATSDGIVSQPKINVISDVVIDPSSDLYMEQDELLNMISPWKTSESGLLEGSQLDHNNYDEPMDVIDSQQNCQNIQNVGIQLGVRPSFNSQSTNNVQTVELVDIKINDVPDGLVPTEDKRIDIHATSSRQRTIESKHNITPSVNDQVQNSEIVKLSELAGHNEIFQSFETNYSLSAFGFATEQSQVENQSSIGKIAEKIRRDVKQLGLLCAATDKEKLINVLVINQQLNVIDPPPVEQSEPLVEPRSIKSILKPPTMPQRVKSKRNLNLKISYGVVTAEEVVQSICDREAADRQQAIEREQDEIAKFARENEIKAIDEELKEVRTFLGTVRSENVSLNKEISLKKKNKTIERGELELQEAARDGREKTIKLYDDRLRELREKMKHLKSFHVAANKAKQLKRKDFETQKKEIGNKVQPSIATEMDGSNIDTEPN